MHLPADQLEESHVEDPDENVAPVSMEREAPDSRVAGPACKQRSEVARWVLCFTVAAALHAGAALALLYRLSESADDSSVDAPVVMLDLPQPSAVAPAQELPPGPMEHEETEPTPPPKEETKPPEALAEVALPKPEPPKPEPPVEEKHMTAPPPARTQRKSIDRWQRQLSTHIQKYQRYPAAARARGESGVAQVLYTIDREGHLLRSSIWQSTGSAALDQEALAVLARAQPMPPPPDDMTDDELTLVMPVRFNR